MPGRSPRELLGAVMGDVLFVVLLFTVIFGGVLLALFYGE